jgi:rhodanese-related sulfurtransferase
MNFIINYVRRQFPDVPCIDTDKAKEWIIDDPQAKILLIDCRRPDEFKVSKIPGAVNVNFRCSDDELKDALKDIEADSKIVNYCSLGYRSAIMTDRICQLGQKIMFKLVMFSTWKAVFSSGLMKTNHCSTRMNSRQNLFIHLITNSGSWD